MGIKEYIVRIPGIDYIYGIYEQSQFLTQLKDWLFRRANKAEIRNNSSGRLKVRSSGKGNKVLIGKNCQLANLQIYFAKSNCTVEIGDNVNFGNQCFFELNGDNAEIRIGFKTTFGMNVVLRAKEKNQRIIIGEDVMFSSNITVRTSDSHSIYKDGIRINEPDSVIIGNHVWIGHNSILLKGTSIGDGSIVGAGSVVTKKIPDKCIAAGSPARIVKTDINWTRELPPS